MVLSDFEQNFFLLKNRRKMTKSGTLVPKGKAKFSNFGFNQFFSRIEPFWVILSKKIFFEKMVEKWLKSGSLVTTMKEKNRKSQKPFIFTNWTILSDLEQKKFFDKFRWIIQYGHFRPLWLHDENCIFWTGFFPDLKFSGIVPSNIIYHFWKFQQNRWCSFWEMVEKPPKNAHICKILEVPDFSLTKALASFEPL